MITKRDSKSGAVRYPCQRSENWRRLRFSEIANSSVTGDFTDWSSARAASQRPTKTGAVFVTGQLVAGTAPRSTREWRATERLLPLPLVDAHQRK
jgi:hypothetical protein